MLFFRLQAQRSLEKNLVQDRISKIRNLLPNVPNLIKFGEIAHHNQQNETTKYVSSAAIPLNEHWRQTKLFIVFVYSWTDVDWRREHNVRWRVHRRIQRQEWVEQSSTAAGLLSSVRRTRPAANVERASLSLREVAWFADAKDGGGESCYIQLLEQ